MTEISCGKSVAHALGDLILLRLPVDSDVFTVRVYEDAYTEDGAQSDVDSCEVSVAARSRPFVRPSPRSAVRDSEEQCASSDGCSSVVESASVLAAGDNGRGTNVGEEVVGRAAVAG